MRFRAAASSDFAAVKRLQHEINPRNGADAAAADDFQAILDHPGTTIWLAEADAPIACATLHILPNMTWGGAPYAVIENVGVEAASRGAGVGRALMAHLAECAEAAGCWKVMAQTGPAKGAAGFYAACGFDAEGRSGFIMRFEANMRSGERMEKMR